MRKLLHELFYIPQHGKGKMREKAFMARIAVSVFAVILCLSAMGITAYAWFSGGVTSASNKIVSATYDLDWKITVKNGEDEQTSVNTGIKIATDADAPKTYEIFIEQSDTSTASTGFCVIKVDFDGDGVAEQTYHTAQIGKDTSATETGGERKSLTFTLTLNQAATITLSPHWGTSSCYDEFNSSVADADANDKYITDNETIVIGTLKPTEKPADEQQGNGTTTPPVTEGNGTTPSAPTTTTPSTTTPSTTEPSTTTPPEGTTPSTTEPETTEPTPEPTETTGTTEPDETSSSTGETSVATSEPAGTTETSSTAGETTSVG